MGGRRVNGPARGTRRRILMQGERTPRTAATGITVRHQKGCPWRQSACSTVQKISSATTTYRPAEFLRDLEEVASKHEN
jgi:hypothetical protein